MQRQTAILILGYKRPNLLENRLKELVGKVDLPIIVSIDFLNTSNSEISNQFLLLRYQYGYVDWRFRNQNLGLAKHMTTALSEVFQSFDNCIVIEDDVQVSPIAIASMKKVLCERLPDDILTVGLFGFLPSFGILNRFIKNYWRETKYFSAWGWSIQREDWEGYSLELAKIFKNDLEAIIQSNLGVKRVPIWLRRFGTVEKSPRFTWDYQMFLYGLVIGKRHLLPKFRLADNLGFGVEGATNTTSGKPLWYLGKAGLEPPLQKIASAETLSGRLLQAMDSATWVSDSPAIQGFRHLKRSAAIRFRLQKAKVR